ncbi:MAG: thioredoxin family protein [Nitrospinales bacterium]
MAKIQFLTMVGCPICAKVKKSIEELKPEFPELKLEEIDMTTPEGQKLVQKHQIMASPGIIINGEFFSSGDVSKDKLREKFKEVFVQ